MSNQPNMMQADAAYNVLQQRAYIPVFFEKVANDWGWRPADREEAATALRMAAQLRLAYNQQQKHAQAKRGSLLTHAQQELNTTLKKAGFQVQKPEDLLIKQAAVQSSFDPELAHAVLSLHAQAE